MSDSHHCFGPWWGVHLSERFASHILAGGVRGVCPPAVSPRVAYSTLSQQLMGLSRSRGHADASPTPPVPNSASVPESPNVNECQWPMPVLMPVPMPVNQRAEPAQRQRAERACAGSVGATRTAVVVTASRDPQEGSHLSRMARRAATVLNNNLLS